MEVGDMLPDFEVVMNDGSVVTDEILKEKVSVVMFFHTTCPDCQQALPRMQQIYDEYASKGVLFTLISRESGNFEGKIQQDFFGRSEVPFEVVSRKAVVPTDEEIARNPRSRSAKLRIAVKL